MLLENLRAQLSEIELLQSMFPNPGEIKLEDDLGAIEKYVEGGTSEAPPFVDFAVNLSLGEQRFEVSFNLSHDYPQCKPDVFVRANHLNKSQHNRINADCSDYVEGLERGVACVYSIVDWLRENYERYSEPIEDSGSKGDDETETERLIRLWIYSHHIYNKTKRREILALANELRLTGFCLPGKPGIICVEGVAKDCNAWWASIKSMTWHRIHCKVREEPVASRRFQGFEEIAFQAHGARSNHMDMGEFNKYLESHRLQYIFKELFGFDGKS